MVVALQKKLRVAPLVLLALGVPLSTTHAHQLDEYLQATLVEILPDAIRLHINLTPGVEVADEVLELIDQDRDGVTTHEETNAYAELVTRDLTARLDGQKVDLRLAAASIPELSELRTGWAVMQMEFAIAPISLAAGSHTLTFDNLHLPSIGEYLFNAARPRSDLVQITRQHRSDDQSTGEIEFTISLPASGYRSIIPAVLAVLVITTTAAAWSLLRRLPRVRSA